MSDPLPRTEIAKILLVDDDADMRKIGELALSAVGGWETLLAGSGAEAVELAARERPDAILLDVMMPEMVGTSTLRELRAQAATADIPVIFMTAKAQRREIEGYLSLGACGVIAKPFDPMQLPDEIRGILDNR